MASVIGLDIGSTAVRAAALSGGRRGALRVDRLGEAPLPEGGTRDGEVVDPVLVAEAIRDLWSRHGFKGTRVAMGLGNQQVVVRQLDLPALPEDELRASLQFQVQDAIPIPVDQAILDFSVLSEFTGDDGQRTSRLLLVAAQRSMVEAFVEVARLAKLQPELLDLDAFAMLRSLAPIGGVPSAEAELLIDVGAAVTNLVVHEDGLPRFVRILLMGAGLGPEVAAEDAEEREQLATARAGRLAAEVRGSLDYYAAQVDAVPVARAVVSGSESQAPGVFEGLREALRMDVDFGHPFQELAIGKVGAEHEELVAAQPRYAVAVGLAMGALE